jgi:hypothetical protein
MSDALDVSLLFGELGHVCTPDVHYEDAFLPAPIQGIAALERHRARLLAAFPALTLTLLSEVSQPPAQVLALRAKGTQSGLTEELPKLGTELDLRVVLWCERHDDGRIARALLVADRWQAAQQLGLLPRPGSLGAKALGALQGLGLR